MKKKIYPILAAGVSLLLFQQCRERFLDVKPSTSLIVPASLEDIENLLDNEAEINQSGGLGQLSADEYYYINKAEWEAETSPSARNAYTWAADLYEGEEFIRDWNTPYTSIFYANSALETLTDMPPGERDSSYGKYLRGRALFIRAFAHFDLVKNFCTAYNPATADTDLGIPIRMSAGVDNIASRSNLNDSYQAILSDLEEALEYLPSQFDAEKRNRPSKLACLALLARIYHYMGNYDLAEKHADACLALYSKLIDYNTVDIERVNPFTRTNDEVIISASQVIGLFSTVSGAFNTSISIDTTLLALYEPDDLRLQAFYGTRADGYTYKKPGYNDGNYPFTGLATDEMYLIKAECQARRGVAAESMETLNSLLRHRYKAGTYTEQHTDNAGEALNIILGERRKELVWRGIRWMDLKRLNAEGAGISLKRILDGNTYELPANSPLWVFPIPDTEITLSGITQNHR